MATTVTVTGAAGQIGGDLADALRRGGHISLRQLSAVEPEPPRQASAPDRRREEQGVARGDDVDRRAHEPALNGPPALEGASQVGALEPLEPRPERDVRGRRVLRL